MDNSEFILDLFTPKRSKQKFALSSCKIPILYFLLFLTQVTVGENEGIESALRRFKRQVSKAGIFGELKRLRHHETPVEKYKRKLQQRRRSRRR